ncbi:MAG: Ig-like domain-containing protein, partial [Brevundimonas sp.]
AHTVADYQAALQLVGFENTTDTPAAGVRNVSIQVNDGIAASNSITTAITVTPVNDAPEAAPDTGTTAEDTAATGNVLTNDTDIDGGALTVTQFEVAGDATIYTAGQTATIADVGTLVINADGSYTFTPDADYNGTAPVATYTVSDGTLTDTATLTLTVTAVNDAPVVAAPIADQAGVDGATITSIATAGTFSDAEGDTLTYSATGLPTGLTIDSATGVISGTIDNSASQDGASGVHTVVVTVSDGNGGSESDTFTFTVSNPAPTATGDNGSVDQNSTLTVTAANGLLANDSDPDGDTLAVTQFIVAGDPNVYVVGSTASLAGIGTLTVNADGSYTFTTANFSGVVPVVTYTASDAEGGTNTATLALTVNYSGPTGVDDANNVTEDTPLTVSAEDGLLVNDTDPNNDALEVTGFIIGFDFYAAGSTVTMPGYGDLTINSDGSYSFVPASNFTGAVPSITYNMTDGESTNSAQLNLTVTPVNDSPVNDTLPDRIRADG